MSIRKLAGGFVLSTAIALGAASAYAAGLPEGYAEVEYVEATGSQYVDTGIVPKTTTRLVCDFQLTTTPSDRVRSGWGSAGSVEAFWFGTDNDHVNFACSVSGNSVQANTGVPVDTNRHSFDISMSAIEFDGTNVVNPASAFTDAASGKTMYLFSSRQGWNPNLGPCAYMRIYSCQIYDGVMLVRDFVPAVRGSDDKAGLYDRATDAFFANSGSGNLTAGPEKPAGDYYVGVEYIESDGDQYIDTLWTNGNSHVVTLNVQPTAVPTKTGTGAGGVLTYYGCRRAYDGQNISMFLDYVNNKPSFNLDFNNGNYQTYRHIVGSVSTANRYVLVDSAAARVVTCYDANGDMVSSVSNTANCTATFSGAGSAYLFAINDMSSGSPALLWTNKALMKFYGATVEAVGGTQCCNLVPCLKNGSEPGVYDTVRDLFLPNSGSGSFTYGAATGIVYGDDPGLPVNFAILPIPNQYCLPGVTPEPGFTVTNTASGAYWTFAEGGVAPAGCPFEVSYSLVDGVGTVTATGKAGEGYEGVTISRSYSVTDELLVNGGFESGAWAPGWTASGNYAAIGNSSSGYQPNYGGTFISGTYCAILQRANVASQVFTNEAPWCAELTWKCKQRGGAAGVPYAVSIDGVEIFSDPLEAASGAIHYQTVGDVVLLPGEHTLTFQTKATADKTLFLDDVSLHVVSTNCLTILPIANQSSAEGPSRPEFVVSNRVDGQAWTVGGDIVSPLFDVVYSNNSCVGTATVTVSGKGEFSGEVLFTAFGISEDDAVSTSDASVRRISVVGDLVYVFTNASSLTTLTTKRSLFLSDALLVGGGGAGGINFGGGGGGGGVIAIDGIATTYTPGGTISFSRGAGGRPSTATAAGHGRSGGNSVITLGGIIYTAKGGGGGGNVNQSNGIAGASGGGGTKTSSGGAGTAGQGYAGAAGSGSSLSGGGGGAGHAGYLANTTDKRAGNGGEGVTNDITGVWTYYGGGGGGGGSANGNGLADPGYGGLGGGGNGGKDTIGQNGADGFGGGGGGAGYDGDRWGSIGGTGTVILRFKTNDFEIDPVPDQYISTGASTPDPVVRSGGTLLTKGDDYTVAYSDNTAPGTATMTITGIGTYAGKVGYASFTIATRYFLKPAVAAEGDGSSWADAMSVTNFFATCGVISNRCEVWIAAGTVPAAALTATVNAPFVVRGGFAGTETTLAERPSGTLTVFDGAHSANCMLNIVNPDIEAVVELDQLKFCNARENGFIKTGVGSLRLVNCVVEGNGKNVEKIYGRGMNVSGGGEGTLVISNCTFAGNRNTGVYTYGGFGIYISSFANALVEDTLFVTNGYTLAAVPASGNCGVNGAGSAIYATGTPTTLRRCRFVGNVSPLWDGASGGVVVFAGASGGSLVDHCVFIGNSDRVAQQVYSGIYASGALAVRLSSATAKVKVTNCTFAYNLAHADCSAGGISVHTGDVEVENTILWKNLRGRITVVGYGSDVQVQSNGKLSIRNSLVTTLDGTGLISVNPDNLVIDDDSVIAVDPKLVTTTEAFESLLTLTSSAQYYKTTVFADLVAMDAHLLSPTGYFVNGGAAGPATTDYSPAIDRGDPTADYSNEPAPNGSRLNLGAYGNTAEASSTAIGQPEANVAVTFPDGMTKPKVTITMGLESGVAYSATVQIYCSTGGVVLANQSWDGVANGDVLELDLPYYLVNGANFKVLVTINAPNATSVEYQKSETVDGDYPPFYGKGGGANVIHVRQGANCLMNGTSWTDAYPDLSSALASSPDASKTEMWLAVTNNYMEKQVALTSSLTIRGGFTGVENSADERAEGATTRLDGNNVYRTMNFSVAQGATLTVERVVFTHSANSELAKAGAGDLIVRDCWFTDSIQSGAILGRGIYASGGTARVANCKFTNLIGPADTNNGGGDGICFSSCTAAYVDDCIFVTNGLSQFIKTKMWGARHRGAGVWVDSTPAIFRNCRFAANIAAMHESSGYSGTMYFSGASGGSKLINCTVVGNSDSQGSQSSATIVDAGSIVCTMSATNQTLDVENCTVAYNITQGQKTAAGITVIKGTVNVKDSIVYGNVRGLTNIAQIAGADFEVKENGYLNLRYSLVTGLTSNYVHSVNDANLTIGPGVIADADPLLATTTNDFWKLFTADGKTGVYIANGQRGTCAALDVHPRTHTGYFKDGVLTRDQEKVESPTIDAGDPESDYSLEPVVPGAGYNGRRVNLGFSGNTPEAALTAIPGFFIILR